MRSMLYSEDEAVKIEAKTKYIHYIDQVMSATYGNFPLDMEITHNCTTCTNVGSIDDVYKNRESVTKSNDLQKDNQPLRDARHKIKSHEIDGQVMQCKTCNNLKRPTDIISDSLKNLKDKLKSNVPVPLSRELLDVAAYRFGYDVDLDKKQVTTKSPTRTTTIAFGMIPGQGKFC